MLDTLANIVKDYCITLCIYSLFLHQLISDAVVYAHPNIPQVDHKYTTVVAKHRSVSILPAHYASIRSYACEEVKHVRHTLSIQNSQPI